MIRVMRDIAEIRLGYQPKGKVIPQPASPYRIIQIKDFDDNPNLATNKLTPFDPDGRSLEQFLIRNGDVLFLARGHRNWAVSIDRDMENVVAVAYFLVLRLLVSSVQPDYLAWYLNQAPAQAYLAAIARRGTHMPVVPKSALADLPVEIPSLEMQQRVVAMNRLARRERQLEKQIAAKREKLVTAVSLNAIRRTTE